MCYVIKNLYRWIIWVGIATLFGCGEGDGDKLVPYPKYEETRCPYGVGTEMAEPIMMEGVEHLGCELKGQYTYEDLTIQEGRAELNTEFDGKPVVYVLDGVVELGSSESYKSKDEIEAVKVATFVFSKVKVRAKPGSALVVHRNAAIGTDPATQFASIDEGFEGQGEWGGIVIYGFGRNSQCPDPQEQTGACNIQGEFGNYGGSDDNGNNPGSPVQPPRGLIAEAGGTVNGETLAAVTLHSLVGVAAFHHMEIVNSGNDGIYIDGGDVKFEKIVIENSAAHAIHWGGGYRGVIQETLILHGNDKSAIKAESDSEEFFSAPTIGNLTLINSEAESNGNSGTAMEFNGTAGGFIYNSVITGFSACVDISAVGSNARIKSGEFVFTDTILHCGSLLRTSDGGATIGEELLEVSRIIEDNPELGLFREVSTLQFPFDTIQISARAKELIGDYVFKDTLNYYGAVKSGLNTSPWFTKGFAFDYTHTELECSGVGRLQAETVKVNDENVSACLLNSGISQDVTLKSKVNNENIVWLMEGIVRFGDPDSKVSSEADIETKVGGGHTLRISSGVKILAKQGAALIVERGSRLQVNGTQTQPVIFSSVDDDFDGTGEWGGIVLNGFAVNNQCGNSVVCNTGDDTIGYHGGDRIDESSGSASYLKIFEAGGVVNGKSLAALTFNSVGSGTDIHYLAIDGSKTVALDLQGGAANFKNVLLTDNLGENLRWNLGYQGTLQQGFIQLPESGGSTAISGFNSEETGLFDAEPRSKPAIVNFIMIGNEESTTALRLQKGSGGFLYNSVVSGFGYCLNVDDEETHDLISGSPKELYFSNVVLDCGQSLIEDQELNGKDYGQSLLVADLVFEVEAKFDENYLPGGTGIPPLEGVIDLDLLLPAQQEFIDATRNYFGAVSDSDDRWYKGWSNSLRLPLSSKCNKMGSLSDFTISLYEDNDGAEVRARVCELRGVISTPRTLDATIEDEPVIWLLAGTVRIGVGDKMLDQSDADELRDDKVTLTIKPGALIMAADPDSRLWVTRGGQLIADGKEGNENNEEETIYFLGWHSDMNLKHYFYKNGKPDESKLVANEFLPWWGVRIDGFAKNNLCPDATSNDGVCNLGDDESGYHGGYSDEDSSGILKHINFYGAERLWLNSVGRGTEISNIMIEKILKELGGTLWDELKIPIVFFNGGVANINGLHIAPSFHNVLQWNHGYRGTLQHINIVHYADYTYDKVEANQPAIIGLGGSDNGTSNTLPSMPTLINMSLSGSSYSIDVSPPPIYLAQGSGLFLHNSIVGRTTWEEEVVSHCLDVDGQSSADLAGTSIVFHQVALDCEEFFASEDDTDSLVAKRMTESPYNDFMKKERGMNMVEDFDRTEQFPYGFLHTLENIVKLGIKDLDISASTTVDTNAVEITDYLGQQNYNETNAE